MLARPEFETVKVDAATRPPAATTGAAGALRRELRRTLILLAIFAVLLLAHFG